MKHPSFFSNYHRSSIQIAALTLFFLFAYSYSTSAQFDMKRTYQNSGSIIIADSNVNNITIQHSEIDTILIKRCKELKDVSLEKLRVNYLFIDSNVFNKKQKSADSARSIIISESSIKKIMGCRNDGYFDLEFSSDTLTGEIILDLTEGPFEYKNNIVLYRCYVNCTIAISTIREENPQVTFYRCEFGPKTRLIFSDTDIELIECGILPEGTELTFEKRGEHDVLLKIFRTRITGAKLNIDNNFKLKESDYFIDWGTRVIGIENISDKYRNDQFYNFESLLKKFKTEGQIENYKNLDIQYRELLYIKGDSWTRFSNWISKKWWNYGYDKLRVLIWSAVFLSLFWFFNRLNWKDMRKVYTLDINFYDEIDRKEKPIKFFFKKEATVVFFTILIFFSIYIKLERLSFAKMRFVYFFLFQYFIGLFCLIFISKAILSF